MKKIIMILLTVLLVSNVSLSHATSFSDKLPGGKNYLDPNNFTLVSNELASNDAIFVKKGQEYTISFPGFDLIGENIHLQVSGNSLYFDGYVSNGGNCGLSDSDGYCSFTTDASETDLEIIFSSDNLALYHSYYQMDYFQMEEGVIASSYEVYEKPLLDTSNPEFSGTGAYILSYQNEESIASIINNHIVVIDDIDGDITNQIVIESDEYSGNEGVVGLYEVILNVSDASNNLSIFVLSIIVKDEINPTMTGPSNIDVPVHNTESIDSLLESHFNYSDDYDRTPTLSITTDGFSGNESQLGIYSVEFDITDDSLNAISKVISITVVDAVSPVLLSSTVISINTSETKNTESLLNSLTFTDNYNGMEEIQTVVVSDGYQGNEDIPGMYEIIIDTNDTSNNVLRTTLVVTVVDDVHPTISGPLSYAFSYSELHSVENIMTLLSVSDDVDSLSMSDIVVIQNTYEGNENIIGTYIVEVSVSDKSGNSASHMMEIQVIDDISPVIYVDNFIITVESSSTFTSTDAITLLMNSKEIPYGAYNIVELNNEYEGNEDIPGIYDYHIELENENGDKFYKDFVIRVTGESGDKIDANVITRNIVLYGVVVIIIGFLIYKKK